MLTAPGSAIEQRSIVTKILSRTINDEVLLRDRLHTHDPEDDWKSDAALSKANPNWGVSVRPEVIRALQAKAIATPSAENNFKTKHLDVWCNADVGWMDMKAWDACADESLDETDFDGEPCWIGLDLASTNDMTAKVKIFHRMVNSEDNYYLFGDYWLPRAAIERGKNSRYQGWEYLGYLHVNEGPVTDYALIRDSILETAAVVRCSAWLTTRFKPYSSRKNSRMTAFRWFFASRQSPTSRIP